MPTVKSFALVAACLAAVSNPIALAAKDAPAPIVIDPASPGRVFDGIGAASGGGATTRLLINYPEPQRSEILDFLFKPNFGASLQQLKVEIGSDGNSTEGSEPSHMRSATEENYRRGYEWWVIAEAKKRNPDIKITALAWNWPAWVKTANSQATADYLAKFVEGAKREHGVDIDYVGIWNETKMDYAFIKTLKATFTAHQLKTKIVADDLISTWAVVDAMETDPALRDAVDVIGTHYPRYLGNAYGKTAPAKAQKLSAQWGKPLWSTEEGPWDNHWGAVGQQAYALAPSLIRNYTLGRMTSSNIWNLVSSYYDMLEIPNAGLLEANWPWSGHYELTSPLWVVAHVTQFAKPGWRYSDGASGALKGGGSYTALHDGKDYSVIVETLGATAPQTLSFAVKQGLNGGTVHVWRTQKDRYFEKIADITPRGGRFSVRLDPDSIYSLTTTTGQTHGTFAAPPAAQTFPIPYREDFERYTVGETTPLYLSELNGGYEVADCGPGHAKCLRQMTTAAPIPWTYWISMADAGTVNILGDKDWANYRVSADVRIEQPGFASVVGRLGKFPSDGAFAGYQFRLFDTGKWDLRTSSRDAVVTSGQTSPALNVWRKLELVMNGDQIEGLIDGARVFAITDKSQARGMAGIGNGWNIGAYDNFAVSPIDAAVPVTPPESDAPPVAPPRDAPAILLPEAGPSRMLVRWQPVKGATGYRVYLGRKDGVWESNVDAGNATSFMLRTLTSGVTYHVAVAARNAVGEGPKSGALAAEAQ